MNLNQVTVPSRDVEKAVGFYSVLGLILIVKSLPKYARFECPVGGSTFSIHQVEKLHKENGVIIYFEVDDVDKKVHELINMDIEFLTLPKDQSWLWREASLEDPDGNKIIIYHAGKNRKNPPWRIN